MPTYLVTIENRRMVAKRTETAPVVYFGKYRAFYAVCVILAAVSMIAAVFSL